MSKLKPILMKVTDTINGKVPPKKYWNDNYARLPDGRKVYDKDVARHAFKHLRIRDLFNPTKIASAIFWSQLVLFGDVTPEELPKKKNWKYFRDF